MINFIQSYEDFINESENLNESIDVKEIDVEKIQPDTKDFSRMEDLKWQGSTFFGTGAPFQGKIDAMAKLIKDPIKLVRRAKAIISEYGTKEHVGLSNGGKTRHPANPWKSFETALIKMGFTNTQIEEIKKYRK